MLKLVPDEPSSPETIETLVAVEGSATVGHVARLLRPGAAHRDLADAVHALCTLHGACPDLIELAIIRGGTDGVIPASAGTTFAAERAMLATLASAIGPQPSTPGQAQAEAVLVGQRHALDMLVRSDRSGCAIGAALALALDWATVRLVLNAVADRVGIELEHIPDVLGGSTRHVTRIDRACLFGARQLLVQQRGVWHLLKDRAIARDAC